MTGTDLPKKHLHSVKAFTNLKNYQCLGVILSWNVQVTQKLLFLKDVNFIGYLISSSFLPQQGLML
jgi:hypothetical protein